VYQILCTFLHFLFHFIPVTLVALSNLLLVSDGMYFTVFLPFCSQDRICVEGMDTCSICGVVSLECGKLSNVIYETLHRNARNFMLPVVGALTL